MINTISIIISLTFIAIFATIKLIKDKQFKRIAKEGKRITQNLINQGWTKKEAYSVLTDEHKKAINQCIRLNIKY